MTAPPDWQWADPARPTPPRPAFGLFKPIAGRLGAVDLRVSRGRTEPKTTPRAGPGNSLRSGTRGAVRGFNCERVVRTLAFWLRPAFALRVVNRFQRIAGFDRAVALASSALTALIPLAVVAGAVLARLGVKDVADRIIARYDLTGGGAEAGKDLFSPAGGTSTSLSLSGALLMLVAVLSFTRAVQRLFE